MRTREGRPVCDICDRVGNIRQDCYARVDQLNQYQNSQNVHPRPQSGPRIAALEFAGTTEQVVAQFNLEKPQRVNPPFTANPDADHIKRGYESGPTRKVDKSTMTIPPSNQLNHQRGEQEAQPEKVYYARRSNPPTFDSTEVQNQRKSPNDELKASSCHAQPTKCALYQVMNATPLQTPLFSPQQPTNQPQELSNANQATKVQSKSNRNKQGSAKPKTTKSTPRSFPSQRTAFVIGKINDRATKLLVDSGACISVINYQLVKNVLQKDDAHHEVTTSTFPEVYIVSGEKLPSIGQIRVSLLLNGRRFPCQFHVMSNMAHQAVLGRDFLQSNGAIVNFSKGKIKLDKTHPLKMTLGDEHTRPLAILTVQEYSPVARQNDASKLPHAFIHRCKKARHLFLKFLIILLLMSPHSHVNSQVTQESTSALHKGSKLVSDP